MRLVVLFISDLFDTKFELFSEDLKILREAIIT